MKTAKNTFEDLTIQGNKLVLRLTRDQAEHLAEAMAACIDCIAGPDDEELRRCLKAADFAGVVSWWRAGGREHSFAASDVQPENHALFDLDVLILESLAATLHPKRRAA
jgi:hypothetical protein